MVSRWQIPGCGGFLGEDESARGYVQIYDTSDLKEVVPVGKRIYTTVRAQDAQSIRFHPDLKHVMVGWSGGQGPGGWGVYEIGTNEATSFDSTGWFILNTGFADAGGMAIGTYYTCQFRVCAD